MPHGWQCICFDIGQNGCHWTSSFFLFAVCVEAIGRSDVRWAFLEVAAFCRGHLYGSCWLSVPQKSDCGIDSQGVASAKSARLPFASIDILSTKMIDLRESFKQNSSCSPLPYHLSANVRWRTGNGG